jgi:hypothetical protein
LEYCTYGILNGVKVEPFEGPDYRKVRPPDLTIFILGESSIDPCTYDSESKENVLSPSWNTSIILRLSESDSAIEPDLTINSAVELFFDKSLNFPVDYWTFWRASAFANFVRHNLGRKKTRPTSDQWKAGKEPFEEYLIELQPQFVLVLGKGVWDNLPTRYRKNLPPITLDGYPKPQPCFLYPNDNGYAFVFAIAHPSYWHWKGRTVTYYRPWVTKAIEAAKTFHYS